MPLSGEKKRVASRQWRSKPENKNREIARRHKRDARFNAWFLPIRQQLRCEYCGSAYDILFHHRDPSDKRFEISSASRYRYDLVMAEIAKCDIICRSCHVKHHQPGLSTRFI